MYIQNLLVQENICPLKIDEFLYEVVKLLNKDIKSFGNKNCKKDHDHNYLNLTNNSDMECFNEMIRNYIFHLTVQKSKEYLSNNYNENISNEIKNVETFVNKFDNINDSDNFKINNNNNINFNKINDNNNNDNNNNNSINYISISEIKEDSFKEKTLPLLNKKMKRENFENNNFFNNTKNNNTLNESITFENEYYTAIDIILKQDLIINELLKNNQL